MKLEDAMFCIDCKHCDQIVHNPHDRLSNQDYTVVCGRGLNVTIEENKIIYCKSKKLKKEKKENAK